MGVKDTLSGVKDTIMGEVRGKHEDLVLLEPVKNLVRRLAAFNINLFNYGIRVTTVYLHDAWPSRPFGFDFLCHDTEGLLKAIVLLTHPHDPTSAFDFTTDKTPPPFKEDSPRTPGGKFSGYFTKGRGFRQTGLGGESVHLEIDDMSAHCNVHVDSHGYVASSDDYDFGTNALMHGYWDLLSDHVPFLYGRLPGGIRVGPSITPTTDQGGHRVWILGVQGSFE